MAMNDTLAALLARLQDLEEQVEGDLEAQRRRFRYTLVRRRVRFEASMRRHHRTLRITAARYIQGSTLGAVLVAPLVYAVIVPLVLLDLAVTLFQWICSPVYGIPKVPRGDFIAVDRHHLAYLNPIEKLNCAYCGYANGVLAYAREIAGRAEAHWCPIKHARLTRGQHRRYYGFADFGDAEAYRARRDGEETGSPPPAATARRGK